MTKETWEDSSVLVFDTETTGIDTEKDEIIQLGLKEGLSDGAFRVLWNFKPTIPIAKEATEVHGLTEETQKDCPLFKDTVLELIPYFSAADVIIGYNIAFDIDILVNQALRCGIGIHFSDKLIIDAYQLWVQSEPRNLQKAHEKFVGTPFENAHDALADVDATGRVLEGMLKTFSLQDKSIEEVADICNPKRHQQFGLSRHFVRDAQHGAVFTFGKHKDRPLWDVRVSDMNYLAWIKGGNFSYDTKRVIDLALESTSLDIFKKNIERIYGIWKEPSKGNNT